MRTFLLAAITAILTAASSCTYTEEVVERDTTTDVLKIIPDSSGSMETESVMQLNQKLPVQGEDFYLICEYDTLNYDFGKWRVTENKAINMTVRTEGLPEGYKVTIDHVHADISLKSTTTQVDGITQDSMDDSPHTSPTVGFYIDNETAYNNIFAIEAYTEQFYTLWGHAFGEHGHISSSYDRLSENNLIKLGTYAEKMQVVYDLLIQGPDDEYPHVVSVLSEFLIPINTDATANTVTKEYFTGEVVE